MRFPLAGNALLWIVSITIGLLQNAASAVDTSSFVATTVTLSQVDTISFILSSPQMCLDDLTPLRHIAVSAAVPHALITLNYRVPHRPVCDEFAARLGHVWSLTSTGPLIPSCLQCISYNATTAAGSVTQPDGSTLLSTLLVGDEVGPPVGAVEVRDLSIKHGKLGALMVRSESVLMT